MRRVAPAGRVRAGYPRLRAAWRILLRAVPLAPAIASGDSTLPPAATRGAHAKKVAPLATKGAKPAPEPVTKTKTIDFNSDVIMGGVLVEPVRPLPPEPPPPRIEKKTLPPPPPPPPPPPKKAPTREEPPRIEGEIGGRVTRPSAPTEPRHEAAVSVANGGRGGAGPWVVGGEVARPLVLHLHELDEPCKRIG